MGPFDYLGNLLLKEKVLDALQWKAAKSRLDKWGGRVPQVLSEMKLVDEKKMARVLSKALRLPEVNWATVKLIPSAVLDCVDATSAAQYGVLPVEFAQQGKVLAMAMSDPSNMELIDSLSRKLNVRIAPRVSTESDLQRAIRRFYFHDESSLLDGSDSAKYTGEMEIELEAVAEVPFLSTSSSDGASLSTGDATAEPEFLLDEEVHAEAPPTWTPELTRRAQALAKKQRELHRMMSALNELLAEKGWLR